MRKREDEGEENNERRRAISKTVIKYSLIVNIDGHGSETELPVSLVPWQTHAVTFPSLSRATMGIGEGVD